MGKINTCFGYRDSVELAEQKQWYLNLGGIAVFIKSQYDFISMTVKFSTLRLKDEIKLLQYEKISRRLH